MELGIVIGCVLMVVGCCVLVRIFCDCKTNHSVPEGKVEFDDPKKLTKLTDVWVVQDTKPWVAV